MRAALLKREPNTGVFLWKCEIFKSIFFEKYLQTAASENLPGAAILIFRSSTICQRSIE